jgi:hypothetical protein
MSQEVYFNGKGQAYLRKIGGNTGLIAFGNSASIALAQAIEEQKVKDYTSAGGGTAASNTSISDVTAAVTTYNFNPHNLAIATAGAYEAVAGGVIASEPHTVVSQGTLIPLDKMLDHAVAVVVTGTGGTPTYVDGTDYETRSTGIYIVEGGAIAALAAIEASYTAIAAVDVEALVNTSAEYELVFDGVNEGDTGKSFRLNAYRVRISPSTDLPLISDDYAQLNLSITFLQDATVIGTGKSKYYKLQYAS